MTETNNHLDDFLTANDVIAVIGVSTDPNKYGHRVFLDLLKKGYNVYAVHPAGGEIAGHHRYINLSALPQKPDLVVTAVKPEITYKIIQECVQLGIKKFWMQPGSESHAAIDLCRHQNIRFLSGICIIIRSSIKK
jgi:predicted CoA-binding protein